MKKFFLYAFVLSCLMLTSRVLATDYYFHSELGNDDNAGTSAAKPWKTLDRLTQVTIVAGDRILLASGEEFKGSIHLNNVHGNAESPVYITTYSLDKSIREKAHINARGKFAGIIIEDSQFIKLSNLHITANGGKYPGWPKAIRKKSKMKKMRLGIIVVAHRSGIYSDIHIDNVKVSDVYFNEPGVTRSYRERTTAMGTETYGYGIRFFSFKNTRLINTSVTNSVIRDVSHTGLKYNGNKKSISMAVVSHNRVLDTGGPGIQMANVTRSLVRKNLVDGSGSNKDSRNWARGSGMWTWGSQDIIVEHNQFKNANGPADSAGFHIDFNSDNIIFQYNLSANNAGGFIEILGNNHNNTYRYNISINDGHRVKKKGVASQQGKTFWLSGFVGSDKTGKKPKPRKRHGPYNSYIYNNTIYVKDEITAKMAVTRVAKGAMVANNIFHILGDSKHVLGDQYVPENKSDTIQLENFIFKNNLFLREDNWPEKVLVKDSSPLFGDAKFMNPGGSRITDYIPTNLALVKDQGIPIEKIPGDQLGLIVDLKVEKDILGNPIVGRPDMGAIEVSEQRPNIIYILADDLGFGDVGVNGQSKIKTPNLDRLAADGINFTQHYSGATVCGPSRASLLTGFHGGHGVIRGNPAWTNSGKPVDLKPEDVTIAEMLQESGYSTAAIGKWGMSESKGDDWLDSMPLQQGFDYFYGLRTHLEAHHYYWHRLYENNEPFELKGNNHLTKEGVYIHDLFTDKAIEYVKQQSPDKPFFLYLAYMIPHLEMTVPEDSKAQYLDLGWPKRTMETDGHYRNDPEGHTAYAGMVSRMDRDIGRLVQALKDKGLDRNTLVIFTSDNGHEYDRGFFNSNGEFRGKKRDLYEGGIRVPFIARWPEKIQAGSTSNHISAFWDMMATFCDLSWHENCPKSDGISMKKALMGDESQVKHDYLYWEFNERAGPLQAIRKDNWKLIKRYNHDIELYDLTSDVGEVNNLASQYPGLVKELSEIMFSTRTYHPEFTLKKLPNPYKKKRKK